MAHACLLGRGGSEEQFQHGQHQLQRLLRRYRGQRRHLIGVLRRAAGQAEGVARPVAGRHRRQPQVVGVFEHAQALAAVELDGELGRQRMPARLAFQKGEQLRGQRPGIEQRLRIVAGGRTEHQVAHVVATGAGGAEAGVQQALDQRALRAGAHAADLQVATIGGLQHAGGAGFGGRGDGPRLAGAEVPAGQLDAADAAVAGGDDAQQARTGGRTRRSRAMRVVQRGHLVVRRGDPLPDPACRRNPAPARRRARLQHRYTPPDGGTRDSSRRQVSWLAGRHPPSPSRLPSGLW
ncbi:hypothetical protein D3C78_914080 [compost metagenome]